jgi:hypothetical protein
VLNWQPPHTGACGGAATAATGCARGAAAAGQLRRPDQKGSARPQAFLDKGDTLLVVGAGYVIDNNTYRVDTLTAQQIVLTYLPLNTAQTLNTTGGIK